MSGVITQRDRPPVGRANAAMRAQYQNLFSAQRSSLPAHSRVLRQSEQIPGWLVKKHLRRDW
jgi:hypothetical protein